MSDSEEREIWQSTLHAACRKLGRIYGTVDGAKPLGLHYDLLLACAEIATAQNALDRLDSTEERG